jgi:hypothetical protein
MQPNAPKPAQESPSTRPDSPSLDRQPPRLPFATEAVTLEPHWITLVDRATD